MFKSDGKDSLAGDVKEVDAQLAVQDTQVHQSHGALREVADLLNLFQHPIYECLQEEDGRKSQKQWGGG